MTNLLNSPAPRFSSSAEIRSLFPLPIVPFERMMVQDDRSEHPMTCGAEFWFTGKLDRKKFESAVEQACQRHPLFSAHVQYRGSRPHVWRLAAFRPHVRWLGEQEPTDYERAAPIDLRDDIGLRIWVQEVDDQTRLCFDFHHASADGAGGLLFVEDLLTAYHAMFEPSQSMPQTKLGMLSPSGSISRITRPLHASVQG